MGTPGWREEPLNIGGSSDHDRGGELTPVLGKSQDGVINLAPHQPAYATYFAAYVVQPYRSAEWAGAEKSPA